MLAFDFERRNMTTMVQELDVNQDFNQALESVDVGIE